MNRSTILELAREAGGYDGFTSPPTDWDNGDFVISPEELLKFATLVRNATLEEAAERCNNMTLYGPVAEVQQRYNQAYWHCAAAIRAMKENSND